MTPRAFVTKLVTRYRSVLPEDEALEGQREAIIDEVLKEERGKRGKI